MQGKTPKQIDDAEKLGFVAGMAMIILIFITLILS